MDKLERACRCGAVGIEVLRGPPAIARNPRERTRVSRADTEQRNAKRASDDAIFAQSIAAMFSGATNTPISPVPFLVEGGRITAALEVM